MKMQIIDGDKIHPITSIVVWWVVPAFGLYRKLEEIPTDRRSVVFPQPVALAKDWYELLPPEMSVA